MVDGIDIQFHSYRLASINNQWAAFESVSRRKTKPNNLTAAVSNVVRYGGRITREIMRTKVISWLNSRSVFFSRISGERITRRDVILTHTIVIGMMVGGLIIEHHPLVSLVAVAVVALSVKRLNKG